MNIKYLLIAILLISSLLSIACVYYECAFVGRLDYLKYNVSKLLLSDNYESVDSCALAWGLKYNKFSIVNNVELGSTIYMHNNTYKYTLPNIGDDMTVLPSDTCGTYKEIAYIHSHGSAVFKKVEEYFSGADYAFTLENNLSIIYVTTPEGKLKKGIAYSRHFHSTVVGDYMAFLTTPLTTTTIYTYLPHDSKALCQYIKHIFTKACKLCADKL